MVVKVNTRRRETVRQRIVRSAQELFMRRGFADVSIDDIMAGADLTRGSFYSYFESKGLLYTEAVETLMEEKLQIGKQSPADFAVRVIRQYLSPGHYEDIDARCPLIAQSSDKLLTDSAVSSAYERAISTMIEIFSKGMGGGSQVTSRAAAMASMLVGCMTLARSVRDDDLANQLRQSSLDIALNLGGWTTG